MLGSTSFHIFIGQNVDSVRGRGGGGGSPDLRGIILNIKIEKNVLHVHKLIVNFKRVL